MQYLSGRIINMVMVWIRNLFRPVRMCINGTSGVRYMAVHDDDCVVLQKQGEELWRVSCRDIEEIGFCTLDADPVSWDYFFLLNANGRTRYLAIDPEWAGVDEVIEVLSKEKGTDFGLYSLSNSTGRRSVVAWPNEKAGEPFNFLSAMD